MKLSIFRAPKLNIKFSQAKGHATPKNPTYNFRLKKDLNNFFSFEITIFKIFLVRGRGAAPCNTQKSYTFRSF